MDNTLSKIANVYLNLRRLYESFGYRKFAMHKFEEYSFYLENKSFLPSESIITFNDLHGRLMALKPDVTLSILKNSIGREGPEKAYYRESVYRLDGKSGEYREIEQLGLEMINCSDIVSITEMVTLAAKTLEEVDEDYVLCVADIDYLYGLLESLPGLTEEIKDRVFRSVRMKNPHELRAALIEAGAEEGYATIVSDNMLFSGNNSVGIEEAKKLVLNDRMNKAMDSIQKIMSLIGDKAKIKLDTPALGDITYYNRLTLSGYVSKIPYAVLSGGCYDKLANKFGKRCAAGFALKLSDLNNYYGGKIAGDVDILLLYNENSDIRAVLTEAEKLRSEGKSVRTERQIPPGLSCGEMIRM